MQFSLKTLLLFVAYAAVACAGLLWATESWAQGIFFLTFLAILFAIILALFGRDNRPYWVSFALAASAYFVLTVCPGGYGGLFPTTQLLVALNERFLANAAHASPQAPLGAPSGPTPYYQSGPTLLPPSASYAGPGIALPANSPPFNPPRLVATGPPYSSGSYPMVPGYFPAGVDIQKLADRHRIGHCLFATILGFVVAQVASRVLARRGSDDELLVKSNSN